MPPFPSCIALLRVYPMLNEVYLQCMLDLPIAVVQTAMAVVRARTHTKGDQILWRV